jgi:integrase/recombinase XerC
MFLEQFLKYLKFQKRYSHHTVTAYENDILQFSTFLSSIDQNFSTANHQSVRAWIVNLMDDGLESKSVNRKISSLRSFYKYLLKEDIVSKNPIAKVQTPKVAKKLPAFVSEEKLNALLNHNTFTNEFESVRDKLILELLFGTGIRLNELLQLKTNDVHLTEKTLKVLGKRNKERIIPINTALIEILKSYISIIKNLNFESSTEKLIVTNKGKPAYPKLIYRIVNQYLSLITTQDKKSPHILRHTFATSLLNKGADINAIKDLLGHANLAATQVYTHNSIERLKLIYKQAHPKA